MTILEEEKDVDEQLAPPRKKLCLSLSGRNRFARPQTETEPTLKNGQPTINTVDSYGINSFIFYQFNLTEFSKNIKTRKFKKNFFHVKVSMQIKKFVSPENNSFNKIFETLFYSDKKKSKMNQ